MRTTSPIMPSRFSWPAGTASRPGTPGSGPIAGGAAGARGWSRVVRCEGGRAGVIGLGRIGHAIAVRLAAHEMDVAWWGPRANSEARFPRADSLAALAEWSDALFVASRATPDNARQVDAGILRALGPRGVLVNISRGFLVDEEALVAALASRELAGARHRRFRRGTDRCRTLARSAQCRPESACRRLHAGGREALFDQLQANIERYFRGAALLTPVEDPL
jgi:hydroxypyruvate reductase